MAKSSRKRKEATKSPQRTKKQIAYSRKQARQNRIIFLALAVLGLIILAVLAFGLIQEFVVKPGRPVATVNGLKVRAEDFENLLNYRRNNAHGYIQNLQNELASLDPDQEGNEFLITFYEQQLEQLQTNLALAPQTTVDELIDDTLVQVEAQDSGLAVTEAEITQRIRQQIEEDLQRAASSSSQTPITGTQEIPTPIPQERLDEIYQNWLESIGLSERAFRAIVERSLYRTKLQELMAGQVPTTGLVANVQLIQKDTEEGAAAALQRIQGGEEFAVVAREVSSDTLSVDDGGDLGWITTGQLSTRYSEELETRAFALEVGQIEIVESNGNFYVLQVLARDENGPLPAEVISRRQDSALSDWIQEQKASPTVQIERLLEPDQIPPDPLSGF